LITVFGGTPSQQIYVLAAHAVLLGAGLLLSERVFVGWGAAGVAVSVMWALRSYAYAMLALLAVALIVLAVWRLNRPRPAGAAGADDSERRPTGSDSVAFKGEEQPWNS
jgi:membrane protein implicated in regulation of membrane protease activity